jgi:hypothetical protein
MQMSKLPTENPMGVQPVPRAQCVPMQPPMPLADEPHMGPPTPPCEPSRNDAMKAARAKISRRKSLAKQRAQQADE